MQPVVDAHFHIWRRADQPWLNGPMVPRIFGPYEPIRRDYPIEEYLGEIDGLDVRKAVYVQTNWAREDFEKEVAFLTETAKRTGWPHAIVGFADVSTEDVRPQLDRLKAYPLVRGVRMQFHWHEVPAYRFAPGPEQVLNRNVRRNIAYLKDYGYSFDLQLFPAQMKDGAALVAENPETDFILTHCGMLTDDAPETVAAWKEGLSHFAGLANFYAKLSGLGTFIHRNDEAFIALVVDGAIEILGSDRLMFGSNFPIEKLWTSYAELLAAHRKALLPHGDKAAADVFEAVATRVYGPA